ncbi:MAG: hypothetical protein POELPBGB_02941 [Bacteroidia bacterium]|nr:hypothetical protein [Bacteroidia bacterium]
MNYRETTQVPNRIFDAHLPNLSLASLKILLVIIRGTYGWMNKKTGKRKERDRITINQFVTKTGLARRSITEAIQFLSANNMISITDFNGNILVSPFQRKGKLYLYYSYQPVQIMTSTSAKNVLKPVQKRTYNKTKKEKLNQTKMNQENMNHISHFLPKI